MVFENSNKLLKESPTEKMTDSEPDPTKSSVAGVERDGGVQFDHVHREEFQGEVKDTNVFRDNLGRLYYEINKYGADQMFLAKILKGIMPVSDVVYNSGKFLSYKMPVASISKDAGQMNFQERVDVHNLVLSYVFNDTDHHGLTGRNMNVSGNAFGLFDAHLFSRFWDLWNTREYIRTHQDRYDLINKHVKILCLGILTELHRMFGGEDGLAHMHAILDHIKKVSSEVPTTILNAPGSNEEEKTRSFRDEVLKRVAHLENIIKYNQ
ncbi:MAG: hypothetical protein Q8Q13_01065 [bacterium]|nr:hypothetical protein [bacterium]